MKLETQVCSLELAQKLKALGVKQESAFVWEHVKEAGAQKFSYQLGFINNGRHYIAANVAAFTVAELGDMANNSSFDEPLPHLGTDGFYWYKSEEPTGPDTEANARAAQRIYLIENKLITV